MFYALTLQASASPADTTYANQIKSAAILEKLYDQNPQHPGVTHFLIPAYDYHPLAEKGIPAARRYAGIAPAVPQARHMPSHIYSMTGLWEESIASNASALEISKMGLDGIVSKRMDSRYRSSRSADWLQSKNPACAAVRGEPEEDWRRRAPLAISATY